MVFHVKTTLVLDDSIITRLKEEAVRRGQTMSELVESALRLFLEKHEKEPKKLRALPKFDGGGCLVDVADRNALYTAMEGQ